MDCSGDQESRFATLRMTVKIVSALGWLTVGGGALVALLGLIAVAGSRRGTLLGAIIAAGPGFLVAVGGMLIVAAGQLYSCFLAIEANTRATSNALATYLDGRKSGPPASDNGPYPVAPPVTIPKARNIEAPTASAGQSVICPKCNESESVNGLYNVSQYQKFEAVDKSQFGFQSLSLTCRRCGQVFRV